MPVKIKSTLGSVTLAAENVSGDTTLTVPSGTDTVATTTQVNRMGGRKNLIINGGMQVAQRGTSVAPSSGGVYLVDRFSLRHTGVHVPTLSPTIYHSTNSPDEFTHSFRSVVGTGAAVSTDDSIAFETRLEGNSVAGLAFGTSSAKTVTLSFYVKSSVTGTYCVWFTKSGSDRSYIAEYTINAIDTWEKKSVTIPGDTSGSWLTDNNIGMTIQWIYAGDTTSTFVGTANTWLAGDKRWSANQTDAGATTGNIFAITGVQLEVGDTATDFEHRSYGEELALCQRYYQRKAGRIASGYAGNTNTKANVRLDFFPPMRTTPSMIVNAYGMVLREYVAWFDVTAASFSEATNQNGNIALIVGGTHTMSEGQGTVLGNGADYSFDAEL